MIQEDKKLLLKDLCARLPYEVKAWEDDGYPPFTIIGYDGTDFIDNDGWEHRIGTFKPYLRSMSSMTSEEHQDWVKYSKADYDCEYQPEATLSLEDCHLSVDWLNAYHFDYRGLIPKKLAIEVTKENNPYKN